MKSAVFGCVSRSEATTESATSSEEVAGCVDEKKTAESVEISLVELVFEFFPFSWVRDAATRVVGLVCTEMDVVGVGCDSV